ncbi:MAG: sulfite exporter TauE/SafE family protein, partial [Planctomycetaceae bacterium]|nr:sulfite exporter TauE/SafE family protein [Planctomycetaceae bacterium]
GAIGGYRRDLAGAGRLVGTLAVPSLLGGGLGAWLLLVTEERTFGFLVPWLVLFATALFAFSNRIAARFGGGGGGGGDPRPGPLTILYQFLVAVYGGYFGAGIGILMLAMLGTLGMRDIHRMNGVKMVQGMLINAVAIGIFVAAGDLIRWPEAGLMAAAAMAGGYAGARIAKRVPREVIRWIVIATGLVVAAVEFRGAYLP